MIFFRLTCIVYFLFASSSLLNADSQPIRAFWEPAGYGGGGRFTAIATDPTNPQNIYIGSDVAGVFRSQDGGNHFTIQGRGLGGFSVADILVNPFSPSQIFAMTDDGLYHSLNHGHSWYRLSGNARYPSRFFGSRLLVITQKSLWAAAPSRVFQFSLENTASVPREILGPKNAKINALAVTDGVLHAGTSCGVYRLTQSTWESQNNGFPQYAAEIVDMAVSGNTLFAVEKRLGLFCWSSMDGTWKQRALSGWRTPRGYKSIAVHPQQPDLLFIGSDPENWPHFLGKTQDGGRTWKSIQSFQLDSRSPANWAAALCGVERILFVLGTAGTLILTDWWNVWKSSDMGENWIQKHSGLQNTVVNDMKLHPQKPDTLYLCAADNGLMISEDAGKSWRRSMKGAADGHAQEIEISRKDPSRMYLLVNPWNQKAKVHVYASRNAGATWHDIGFSVPVDMLPRLRYVDGLATNMELDPFSDDTVYVGTNGYGVYKTNNAGKDWTRMNQGLTTPFIKGPGALTIHPQHPNTLFASTQKGGIFKSSDGAGTWQRTTDGERFTFGMAIDPSEPSRMVAGCAGNTLLVSSDEGKSWKETRLDIPESSQTAVYSVAFHPKRPGWVLAGTIRYDSLAGEGLFISTDHAETFQQVQMDLPKVNINRITMIEGHSATCYIGFNGTGLFRVEIGEQQ